jgi:hypothetical protein
VTIVKKLQRAHAPLDGSANTPCSLECKKVWANVCTRVNPALQVEDLPQENRRISFCNLPLPSNCGDIFLLLNPTEALLQIFGEVHHAWGTQEIAAV